MPDFQLQTNKSCKAITQNLPQVHNILLNSRKNRLGKRSKNMLHPWSIVEKSTKVTAQI